MASLGGFEFEISKAKSYLRLRLRRARLERNMREAKIVRNTSETKVSMRLNLDGSGKYDVETGCGFLNHMLELFARRRPPSALLAGARVCLDRSALEYRRYRRTAPPGIYRCCVAMERRLREMGMARSPGKEGTPCSWDR